MGQKLILAGAGAVSLAGVSLILMGVTGIIGGGGEEPPEQPPMTQRAAPTLNLPKNLRLAHVSAPMAAAQPYAVYIPSIGVAAPLMELGLDTNGAIQNPPFSPSNLAGWYRYGPVPGQRGAAVITGHLDTKSGPAVFEYLHNVKRGAQIQVLRADRSVAVFVVDKVEHTAKTAFPTRKVYGKLSYPGLRVITCGGSFDPAAHSYRENTIVYAHLAAPVHLKG